jgi:hypothetical protein
VIFNGADKSEWIWFAVIAFISMIVSALVTEAAEESSVAGEPPSFAKIAWTHLGAAGSLVRGLAAAAILAILVFGSATVLASWIPGYLRLGLGLLLGVYSIRSAADFVGRVGAECRLKRSYIQLLWHNNSSARVFGTPL